MSTPSTLNQAYELYKQKPDDPLGVEAFGSALLGYITKAVKGEAAKRKQALKGDLEDVIMDTVLKVWEHLGDFKGESSFSTFVTKVMLNDLMDSDRKIQNRNEIELTADIPYVTKHAVVDDRVTLHKLIDQLSEADKSFILLKLEGLSEAELGAKFGRDRKWAENKYMLLTKKLRDLASSNV